MADFLERQRTLGRISRTPSPVLNSENPRSHEHEYRSPVAGILTNQTRLILLSSLTRSPKSAFPSKRLVEIEARAGNRSRRIRFRARTALSYCQLWQNPFLVISLILSTDF